jgi:hypothetical protein
MNKLTAVLFTGCAMLFLSCVSTPEATAGMSANIVCGGLKGKVCPAAQYCFYTEQEQCGHGDMTGICKPKPKMCTKIYKPVCGCNNKTYGNACVAAAAGISVAHEGKCKGK